jgi:hypothetical protein
MRWTKPRTQFNCLNFSSIKNPYPFRGDSLIPDHRFEQYPNRILSRIHYVHTHLRVTLTKRCALCKANLAKERDRHLLLDGFHERLHAPLDIRLTLRPFPFKLK